MAYADLNSIHVPGLGVPPPVGYGTQLRDNFEYLARPIVARVRRTTNQSIPNATATAVSWDTEDEDTSSGSTLWVPGTPTQMTLPLAGRWQFQMGGQFAINATGARLIYIAYLTRTIGILHGVGTATWYAGGVVTAEDRFPAGAVISFNVYQSSGAALNWDPTAYEIWATARMVGL